MPKTRKEDEELKVDRYADLLRENIRSNVYGSSGVLPSISTLAEEWGLTSSRSIITQVMQQLRSEGYIRMVKNRYVVDSLHLEVPGLVKDFGKWLQGQGHTPVTANSVAPIVVEMPKEVADLFHQPVGTRAVYRKRIQGVQEQQLRIGEIWYPEHLAKDFVELMRSDPSINGLDLIKEKYGLYPVETDELFSGRVPTKEEVRILNIARFQPVIEIVRTSLDVNGNPIMFNRGVLLATACKYRHRYRVEHWDRP